MAANGYPPLKTILLDMDGVIWRSYKPVLDVRALFEKIEQIECRVFCVTNNSTSTVDGYLEKLKNLDVELSRDQIITSGEATACYLKDRLHMDSYVYVIGEDGLRETISTHGFQISDGTETDGAAAVVVGLDFNINYKKIYLAANLIRGGALFIGTNPDKTFPMQGGIAPGAGSIISSVESASGTSPVIIGKPEIHLYQLALARSGSLPEETLMIGDRLETDILGAQRSGIRTGLVLTGISSLEEADNWTKKPDLIGENALDLLGKL